MSDVLSVDEEEVLTMMRTLVAEVRERARSTCMEELKKSLVSAGATMTDESVEGATFSLRRVQFRLKVIPNNVSSVELTFVEGT